jgi:hypothetical protein
MFGSTEYGDWELQAAITSTFSSDFNFLKRQESSEAACKNWKLFSTLAVPLDKYS